MICDEPSKTFRARATRRRAFRRKPALGILLTVTALYAGVAAAEPSHPPAQAAGGHSTSAQAPCPSLSDCDRRAYDYSGTRGRMGLGADPAHPEGPGNAPN